MSSARGSWGRGGVRNFHASPEGRPLGLLARNCAVVVADLSGSSSRLAAASTGSFRVQACRRDASCRDEMTAHGMAAAVAAAPYGNEFACGESVPAFTGITELHGRCCHGARNLRVARQKIYSTARICTTVATSHGERVHFELPSLGELLFSEKILSNATHHLRRTHARKT